MSYFYYERDISEEKAPKVMPIGAIPISPLLAEQNQPLLSGLEDQSHLKIPTNEGTSLKHHHPPRHLNLNDDPTDDLPNSFSPKGFKKSIHLKELDSSSSSSHSSLKKFEPNILDLINEDSFSQKSFHSHKLEEVTPTLKIAEDRRVLTAGGLAIMLYFWTSGGPFGIEPAVGAAGPVIALAGALIITVIWSLPQALLSAELSLMMEENGGNILWVNRAFGNFLGYINAQCNLVQNLVNQSLLVLMFLSYLPIDQDDFLYKSTISFGFILLNFSLNVFGVEFLEKLSYLLFFLINTPFLVEWILIYLPETSISVDYNSLDFFPFKTVHWSLLISTLVWSFGGFDTIGSLAGEVRGGAPTYIRGILISIPLIQFNYISPIISGWLILPKRYLWTTGTFAKVATKVGKLFGGWVMGTACVSSFASYVTSLPPTARNAWAMAKGLEGVQSLPTFLGWTWKDQPITSLIFCCIITQILTLSFNFNELIQVYLVVRLANLFIEFFSLIKLRYSEPNTERPFKIWGGWFGIFFITFPTFSIGIFALVTMDLKSLIVGSTTVGIITVSYAAYRFLVYLVDYSANFTKFDEMYLKEELKKDLIDNSDLYFE